MTKQEVRAITIAKMEIRESNTILDIGAGTGSVSIECALRAKSGTVYACEKDETAIELIRANIERFHVQNIEIRVGSAPQSIAHLKNIDRIFIGGSGGNLEELLDTAERLLNPEGLLCANFILIENLTDAMKQLKKMRFTNIEVTEVSVARGCNIGGKTFFKPNNSVFILSARKGGGQL